MSSPSRQQAGHPLPYCSMFGSHLAHWGVYSSSLKSMDSNANLSPKHPHRYAQKQCFPIFQGIILLLNLGLQLFTLRCKLLTIAFCKATTITKVPEGQSPLAHQMLAHSLRPQGAFLWSTLGHCSRLTHQQSSQIGRACYFLHLFSQMLSCEGTSGEMSGRFHGHFVQISQEFLNVLSPCIYICGIFQFFPSVSSKNTQLQLSL